MMSRNPKLLLAVRQLDNFANYFQADHSHELSANLSLYWNHEASIILLSSVAQNTKLLIGIDKNNFERKIVKIFLSISFNKQLSWLRNKKIIF